MNGNLRFEGENDRIDREATEWLARESRGLDAAEQKEFEAWVAHYERHRELVDEYRMMRAGFRELQEERTDKFGKPDPDSFALKTSRSFRHKWLVPAAIAGLAACLAVAPRFGVPGLDWFAGENSSYTALFEADRLERQFLPDGTLLELKEGSAVEVRFNANRRSALLKRGEVFFSVTKDPSRPFIVQAGDAAFRVVGTAFNVRMSGEIVDLLVTEGAVQVESLGSRSELMETVKPQITHEKVTANQKVSIALVRDSPVAKIVEISKDQVEKEVEWKHETLQFNNASFSEAIAEFNKRNRDQVEIRYPEFARERIDATFRSDNLEAFMELIEISADVQVERNGKGQIIIRRSAKKSDF